MERPGSLVGALVVGLCGAGILFLVYEHSPSLEHVLEGGFILKKWAYYAGLLLGWGAVVVGAVLAVAALVSQERPGSQSPWPPGWYRDSRQPGRLRWWDGGKWTDHTHDPAPSPTPADEHPPPAARPALERPAERPAVPVRERRPTKRLALVAALLAAAAAGAVVAVVLTGGDDEQPTAAEPAGPSTFGEVSAGESRGAAESEARTTASSQVERFGIFYAPGEFDASCQQTAPSDWSCEVSNVQCGGTVRVLFRGLEYLRPEGTDARIGCGD